jgi:hypothetical protein
MSRYNIFSLQRDARRKLTTSDPSASLDLYGAMDEARRNMVKRIAPPEMVREAYLEQAIFDNPESYAVPEDFNYDDAIELKKLSAYRNVDTLWHPFELVFRKRYGQRRPGAKNIMNISYTNGLKTASIFHPTGLKHRQQTLIHNCDSLSDNGTWNIGGNVVNLTVDKLNKVQGHGSLKFDINDSDTSGFIENMDIDSVDLFDYLQIGATLVSLSLDNPKALQSVQLRLYSSATDYYEFTVNHPHDSNVFRDMWNVLKFLFDTPYAVGTPNAKAITGIRFDFSTDGSTMLNNRLDSIYTRKGEVYELTYQSAFCVIDYATGAWKHRATSGNDMLPFEDDSYQVFMLETTYVLQQELYANNAAAESDVIKVKNLLEEAYTYYNMNHKSEVIEEYDTTYIFGNEYDGFQDDPMDDGYYGNNNLDQNEF